MTAPVMLLQSAVIRADPDQAANAKVKAAKAYVDAGLAAQDAGDHDTAIELYTKAYVLVPHPLLLFNIAQAHRLAERDAQAAEYYRKFLATNPVGPEAELARALLAEIDEAELEARQVEDARAAEAARGERARTSGTRKRKRRGGTPSEADERDVSSGARPPWSLLSARLDAGVAYRGRSITYSVDPGSMRAPPSLDSSALAIRLEGQLYPFELSTHSHPLAGLGVFVTWERSFDPLISFPGTLVVPAHQGHYTLGARYRLELGRSALWISLGYARRYFIVDRSSLVNPEEIDTPDVDYESISPAVGWYAELSKRLFGFIEIDAMFVQTAGALSTTQSYGAGRALGIGGHVGIDILLGKSLGMRFGVELNQVDAQFNGTGTMSSLRGVSAAADSDRAIFGMITLGY